MRRTVVIRDPEPPGEDALRLIEQERRREWFRDHWTQGVAFNQHCGIEVRRWDDEAVELFLPYAETLSAHPGIFHGGVVSALLDTTASGAVMAGHDFAKGSRLTTISLAVQYLSVAPGARWARSGWRSTRSTTCGPCRRPAAGQSLDVDDDQRPRVDAPADIPAGRGRAGHRRQPADRRDPKRCSGVHRPWHRYLSAYFLVSHTGQGGGRR